MYIVVHKLLQGHHYIRYVNLEKYFFRVLSIFKKKKRNLEKRKFFKFQTGPY